MKPILTGKPTSPFFFSPMLISMTCLWSIACFWAINTPSHSRLFADGPAHSEPFETGARLQEVAQIEGVQSLPIQTAELPLIEEAANEGMLSTLIRTVLASLLTEEFVQDRDWGKTTAVFDGFRVKGSRISKREKQVNHGFWHRHKIWLVRPEKNFKVEIEQMPGKDTEILSTIKIEVRVADQTTFAWWNLGVKGLNGTIESEARCQMRILLSTTPEIKLNLDSFIPKFKIKPRVIDVQFKLRDLDVSRVGFVEGPPATTIGDVSRKAIEQILQNQTDKIRDKLQHRIDSAGLE